MFFAFPFLKIFHIFAILNVQGIFDISEILPWAYTKKHLHYAPFPFCFPLFRAYKATFFPYTKKLVRYAPHFVKNGAQRTIFSIYSTYLHLNTKKIARNGLFFPTFFVYAHSFNQMLPLFKNASTFLLRDARHALHDIFFCAPLHLRSTSVGAKRVPPAHRTRRMLHPMRD